MKKDKIKAMLLSSVMALTATALMPVSAEETQRSIMDYSFEELLAMSDEEICSISEEVAYHYHGGTLQDETDIMQYLVMFYSDEPYLKDTETMEVDAEKLISAMGIPANMVSFWDEEIYFGVSRVDDNVYPSIEVFIDLNVYPEYDRWKVCHTVNAVLNNNPVMPMCDQMLYVGGGGDSSGTLGDVDANGDVNAADSAEVLIKAAKIGIGETATSKEFALMDVNSDGLINAEDASVILVYAAQVGTLEDMPDFAEYLAILKETLGITENFE